jgi:hypothetical protein
MRRTSMVEQQSTTELSPHGYCDRCLGLDRDSYVEMRAKSTSVTIAIIERTSMRERLPRVLAIQLRLRSHLSISHWVTYARGFDSQLPAIANRYVEESILSCSPYGAYTDPRVRSRLLPYVRNRSKAFQITHLSEHNCTTKSGTGEALVGQL